MRKSGSILTAGALLLGLALFFLPLSAGAASTTTYNTAVPATFAAGVQNTNPNANFTAISCSSPGNCTAAGNFSDATGHTQAFTQTETNNAWSNGVPATFAAGVQNTNPNANFTAISCSSPGNCTAAGYFTDATGHTQAFTQSMTTPLPVTTTTPTTTPVVQVAALAATGTELGSGITLGIAVIGLGGAIVAGTRRKKPQTS